MEHIMQRDGLFTLTTNENYKCVCKTVGGWVGGVYDIKNGQFCDGKNFSRGMTASALCGTYTREFTSKKQAMAWLVS